MKRIVDTDRAGPGITDTDAAPAPDPRRSMLAAYLESSAKELLATIRLYVVRAGVASGPEVTPAAQEVLQETSAEALAHAARFDPIRSPSAWLLGIAINVIKRRVAAEATRRRREPHMVGWPGTEDEAGEESDGLALVDRLATPDPTPGDALADAEAAAALLAPLPSDDAEVLRLALIEDCDAATLAARLGTTPGTARMRLHRALRRLRAAWLAQAPGGDEAMTSDQSATALHRHPERGGPR